VDFQHEWKKYGPDCFEREILELVPNGEDLLEAEQRWVLKTRCYERAFGYNMAKDVRRPMLGRGPKSSLIESSKRLEPPKSVKISNNQIRKEFQAKGGNPLAAAKSLGVTCADIYRAIKGDLATLAAFPREA
jgi:hypothetical protein